MIIKPKWKPFIASTQYSFEQRAFEIYLSGCSEPHCEGCHNPELWTPNQGKEYSKEIYEEIFKKVSKASLLIDKFWILGGEPLDSDIFEMIKDLSKIRPIWLFTRYHLYEVPEYITVSCDYIKTGEYDKNLLTNDNNQYNVSLASENQQIFKIKKGK
jgi:anaerobic ribonucleoside-triphosphate reductase activating protein